jgi:flagellar basal-body rod protein FlgB
MLADAIGGPIALRPSRRAAAAGTAAPGCRATGKTLPVVSPARRHPRISAPAGQIGTTIADMLANFCAGDEPMSNEGLFGVHGTALAVRSQRMGVLASNIANASTPGYKAKDVDFRAALASAETGGVDNAIDGATLYRIPLQPSADGNTVELATEQTAFAENAVAYQTTLAFLNGRISTITRALRGE